MKKVKAAHNQLVQYKATSSLVLQLFVQSQLLGQQVTTRELITYPMTLTPYAIATVDGHFAKTNMALCMNKIMSDEEDVDLPPVDETLAILDGNATLYMKEVPARIGQIEDKVYSSDGESARWYGRTIGRVLLHPLWLQEVEKC